MGLILLAVLLLMFWLMMSRQRKQQRELMATQDSLQPGARVMTSSGLYGTVVEVESDEVVLEIAPGVQTRWNKRAIGHVVPTETSSDTDEPDDTPAPDDTDVSDTDTPAGPDVSTDSTKSSTSEAIRSEAGYAPPPNSDATDGSTGTDGR